MSMHEARLAEFGIPSIDHKPGARYAPAVYETLAKLSRSRTGEEYVQGVREMKAVIETVEPDVIAIEEFFFQAMDACIVLGREFCVLGPGTLREHASNLESLWMKMTEYPALVVTLYAGCRWMVG
jgi:Holliday junction resolvasome RuvABC endonuclease subunit